MHQTPPVLLTLDRSGSGRLLRSLRGFGLLAPQAHPWGSSAAYEDLLTRPSPFVLLDAPDARWMRSLPHHVRVLARTAPVTVLAPPGTDVARLLAVGALNVLPRDLPPREAAARIAADVRWARGRVVRRPAAPGPRPSQRSQRVVLSLLTATAEPWCCHDLMRLLGAAGRPLDRAALRARLRRLAPYVERLGLVLESGAGRGRTLWSTRRPGAGGPARTR